MGILHQAVKTITRTAASLGRKIISHVRATKRALSLGVRRLGPTPRSAKREEEKSLSKWPDLPNRPSERVATLSNRCGVRQRISRPKLKQKFLEQIELAQTILNQTEQKLQGQKSIPERIVSFYDSEAPPIRKGKLNKAVEFGRTLQLVQDRSGVIVHYEVHRGNPSDSAQLLSVVRQTKTSLGIKPKEIAADRGYYSADNVVKLGKAGIEKVGIPKVGRLSRAEKTHQRQKWFRQLQRFRCGIEASISMLKRKFGLGRVLAKGSAGTAIWTGLAIFTYNLWQRT